MLLRVGCRSEGNPKEYWYHCFSYSWVSVILLLTNPQSCLALVETVEATFLAPYLSSAESTFCLILCMPLEPISLVLWPSQKALSLADQKISLGLMSTRGMSSLTTREPSSRVGCWAQALPLSIARQQAVALQVQISRTSAPASPQCLRYCTKLSLPPFCSRQTSSWVHSSRFTLFTFVAQEYSRKAAAQLRHRKIAWLSQAHCRLGLPQCAHWVLLWISNSFSRDSIGFSYFSILQQTITNTTHAKRIQVLTTSKAAKRLRASCFPLNPLWLRYFVPSLDFKINISQTMNLKIDRVLPYPPTTNPPYLLTTVYLPAATLLLYSSPPPPEKPQQPKKKFAFKANVAPAPTVENVHLFDIATAQWRVQQTKGKFPTRREHSAVACMGPCLMLYGGTQLAPSKQLSDLFGLNLSSWQWKKLFTMEAPPPAPNAVAVALSEDKLAIVCKTVWIFQAKEVIWSNQSTDLPGGIWKRVKDLEIPFEPRCACLHQGQIVVFGFGKDFEAASVNVQKEQITPMTLQGHFQGKGKSLALINNTQNLGFLADGCLFGSFFVHNNTLFIGDWLQSKEIAFESIVSVQTQEVRANYGITTKKELNSVIVQMPEIEAEQELPNTARQVTTVQVQPHFSSQKREFNDEVLHSPPFNPQPQPALLTQNLSNLLAQQWLRRRVLEQKGHLLQQTIKKAERMVLALCRYGDEDEKRNHISKVCKLRESLCRVFQSQSLILQKMTENPVLVQLRQRAIRSVQSPSNLLQFNDL